MCPHPKRFPRSAVIVPKVVGDESPAARERGRPSVAAECRRVQRSFAKRAVRSQFHSEDFAARAQLHRIGRALAARRLRRYGQL
jgi:hypothetical protein